MLSEALRRRHLPHTTVRTIDELVDTGTVLGKAVNKTAIPFVSWVEVKFLLKSGDALKPELVVPLLIARNPRVPEEPIIGYNVIEEIVKCLPGRCETSEQQRERPSMVDVLMESSTQRQADEQRGPEMETSGILQCPSTTYPLRSRRW